MLSPELTSLIEFVVISSSSLAEDVVLVGDSTGLGVPEYVLNIYNILLGVNIYS